MPSVVKASAVALALLGILAACGDDSAEPSSSPAPSTGSTPTPTTSNAPTDGPTATTPAEPTNVPTADCGNGTVVPDGTWEGPITMDVRGSGGQSGFADSKGKGRLAMTVEDGQVTNGTWTLTWTSHGRAETASASATVDLTGKVTGSVKGTAAKPVLPDTWAIKGTAHVTRPVQTSAPFDETGKGSETMTVRGATCDQVTGTFVPSFNSKEAAATFRGRAAWTGRRR